MRWLLALLLALTVAAPAAARDVAASDPVDVSVTIYRAPWRNGGSIQLGSLGGFAVVSEKRRVTIPAGRHRLRFSGVVDGIIPASAIVSGLPGGILEKNQDSALLSPSALMRAARYRQITLQRTDPDTGKRTMVKAEVVSAGPDGVVFRTAGGTEALRCSGLPEMFHYDLDAQGLNAKPTLSVMTNSPRSVSAVVTLTYIAEGFDWSANYTAHLNPDGKTLELGGWITLANGNSVSLAGAQVQIVAGGLNRAYVQRYVNNEPQVVASCWPMEKTSDVPLKPDRPYELVSPWLGQSSDAMAKGGAVRVYSQRMENDAMPAPPAPMVMAAPPPPPAAEQLGDLKLYRVPQRTTVAAMQMKQTRLIDQSAVPYQRIYTFTTPAYYYGNDFTYPASALLRLANTKKAGLGLPLPSGSFLIDQDQFGRTMVVGQPNLADTAEGEKVELLVGQAPDVQVSRRVISREGSKEVVEMTVTNAGPAGIDFELVLAFNGPVRASNSTFPLIERDGKHLFEFKVPAGGTVTLRYTAHGG